MAAKGKNRAVETPYWGELPPPNVVKQNFQQPGPDEYANGNGYHGENNRDSIQTEGSTMSPLASPRGSTFQPAGLAPRPPSFASRNNRETYNKDFLEKRRRRETRDKEYQDQHPTTVAPPPAPDVPRAPPPLSYREPQNNGAVPPNTSGAPRTRPSQRGEGPGSLPSQDPFYQQAAISKLREKRPSAGDNADLPGPVQRPDLSIDTKRQAAGAAGTASAKPDRAQHTEAAQPRPRQASVNEIEARRRREWAPDRSPLQRLELTLDSLTKEEKRARAQEAELLAREGKSGRGSERPAQNSVHFRDRPVTKADISSQPAPQTRAEASVTRNLSQTQYDQLRRNGNADKRRGIPPEGEFIPATERSFDNRPPQERRRSTRQPGRAAVEPEIPKRGSSFRERSAIPVAAAAATVPVALGEKNRVARSGSNKLKKNPPDDPWLQSRVAAEREYQDFSVRKPSIDIGAQVQPSSRLNGNRELPVSGAQPRGATKKAQFGAPPKPTVQDTVDDLSLSSEDENFPPIRRGSQKKIEQLTGFKLSSDTARMAPQSPPQPPQSTQQPQRSSSVRKPNTMLPIQNPNGTVRDASSSPEPHEDRHNSHPSNGDHHHLSNVMHPNHNRQSRYQPGSGLYGPPFFLDEWKRAGTALLSAPFLDLDVSQEDSDQQQAWWEAQHSAKRRGSTSKNRKITSYDGEVEDIDGMIIPDLSLTAVSPTADEEGLIPSTFSRSHTWYKKDDPVVARARQYIGFQGTSESEHQVQKRNKSWFIEGPIPQAVPPVAASAAQANIISQIPSSLSTGSVRRYSDHCPKKSMHNKFHPFHKCPPEPVVHEEQKLTKVATRLIRMRETTAPTAFRPPLYLKCGPLLRYCGIRKERQAAGAPSSSRQASPPDREVWRGNVMIVTSDAASSYETQPTLRLFVQPLDLLPHPPTQVDGEGGELAPEHVDPIAGLPKIGRDGSTRFVRPVDHLQEEKDLSRDETDAGLFETHRSIFDPSGNLDGPAEDVEDSFAGRNNRRPPDGEKLAKYKEVKGFRLHAEQGTTFWRFNIEVELRENQQRVAYRINKGPSTGFWVPPRGRPMNIMFHSCNGFSASVNPDQFSGPDPMWRDVLSTHQSSPFHVMIGGGDQIYNDVVMSQTKMFKDWLNIKNPLTKINVPFTPDMQDELERFYLERYCMWFSQGLFGVANSQIPMINIFDDHDIIDGFGSYPDHFMESPVFSGLGNIAFKYYLLFQHQTVVDEGEEHEPSWVLGARPGPFIHELSRSIFTSLGGDIAFLGPDCRTERMRDEIIAQETYDKLLDRCEAEIVRGQTKHLIVLLGVPVAYPRLAWLENILTSKLMDPVKAAGKAGLFGGFINKFDGGVEILDDLDDHWTAHNHKSERNWFIEELQGLAAEKSVRITMLSGDVHLAGIGQFYSNPKLGIPKDKDHRYMPNIISSAIVNTPPPEMMADVLNKRNKVHHLNPSTDEDMIPIFTHDVNGNKRNNKRLLPRRNWCQIREYQPGSTPPATPSVMSDDEHVTSPEPRPGIFKRLSQSGRPSGTKYPTNKGPEGSPPVTDRPPVSRPPISGGLLRHFSLSRGRRTSDAADDANGPRPKRTGRSLSLSRAGSIFRRSSSKQRRAASDGHGNRINGYGPEDPTAEPLGPDEGIPGRSDTIAGPPYRAHLRGGAGTPEYANENGQDEYSSGDDDAEYFTAPQQRIPSYTKPPPSGHHHPGHRGKNIATGQATHTQLPANTYVPDAYSGGIHSQEALPLPSYRPNKFHRTPTGLSEKAMQKNGGAQKYMIDLEGGLEICINVEVSPKDPSGCTVPYRLLVPALHMDEDEGEVEGDWRHKERKMSMGKRLLSVVRSRRPSAAPAPAAVADGGYGREGKVRD